LAGLWPASPHRAGRPRPGELLEIQGTGIVPVRGIARDRGLALVRSIAPVRGIARDRGLALVRSIAPVRGIARDRASR